MPLDVFSPEGLGLTYVDTQLLLRLRSAAKSFRWSLDRLHVQTLGERRLNKQLRGLEFDEIRPYVPGDDVRSIDWRTTAHTGKLHTKVFREEQDLSVLLCVDQRQGMRFATQGCFKSVMAAHIAALMVWQCVQAGNPIGGWILQQPSARFFSPSSSQSPTHIWLKHLAASTTCALPELAIDPMYELIAQQARLKKVSTLVMISDFEGLYENETWKQWLQQISKRTHVQLVWIYDPFEKQIDYRGNLCVTAEDRHQWLNTSVESRKNHRERFEQTYRWLQSIAHTSAGKLYSVATNQALAT